MKLKVLIMDADPNIVMPLELLMRKNGYEVFIARNSTEAIECIQQEFPKLAVLDVAMPGSDEVCQYISKRKEACKVKVILLWAKEEDINNKVYGSGVDLLLFKPPSTRLLLEKIKDLLN